MNGIGRILVVSLSALLAVTALGQRFTVAEKGGKWWIVDPQGKLVFSRGVCCLDTGDSWQDYNTDNPSYAAFRFYTNKADWAKSVDANIAKWGFNTIGAWSAYKALGDVPGTEMYLTPILHIGSSAGAPWLDMWDPEVVKTMDGVAKSQMAELKGNQRVIGYFSDNEMGWWYGALWEWAFEEKTKKYERGKVLDLLRSRYAKWDDLRKDFDPEGASSFDELAAKGRLFLKPGSDGVKTVEAWISILADRYYSLCRKIIKKYDPDALFLGDRYISNYDPMVATAAGKYCDVVSTNLNADWTDGTFARFHLASLYALTHRPIMITEYYQCATENLTGSPNSSSGFPTVQTQEQRVAGFVRQSSAMAEAPFVVGAHWFQYYDEPAKGRGDGENYNMGLVSVNNQVYEGMVQASATLNLADLHATDTPHRPDVAGGCPPAAKDPADLRNWDREHGFVPPEEKVSRGDLYASWAPDALHLGVLAEYDRFSEAFYRGEKDVPEQDLPRIEVSIPSWHVSFDAALDSVKPATRNLNGVVLQSKPGTRIVATIKIPSPKELAPGDEVDIHVKLLSRARSYTTTWDTKLKFANKFQ